MQQLRHETEEADAERRKQSLVEQNPGFGYGGKFGVETDRMDQSAVGHDYVGKVDKHASQKDYSDGFGGKFGVQTDRVDKSALSWDHKEKVEKHSSQKDYSSGFGGKFGVQNDRVDKSAVGWDHIEKVEKHESQKDYSHGFGGKFGVQEDRKDASAVGWDYVEASQKHESQLDHKVVSAVRLCGRNQPIVMSIPFCVIVQGFGGKFGVQSDRMDRSAIGFQDNPEKIGTNYTKTKPDIGGAKPSNLRAKFENFAKVSEEENNRRLSEQKKLREEKDRVDRELAAKKTSFETKDSDPKLPAQTQRTAIDTGRSGGIGSAISAFNQAQSPTAETAPLPRVREIDPIDTIRNIRSLSHHIQKMPIQLPKNNGNDTTAAAVHTPQTPPPTPASASSLFGQPDVIPTAATVVPEQRSSVHSVENVPPPFEFSGNSNRNSANTNGNNHQATDAEESLYANVEPKTTTTTAVTQAATEVSAPAAAAVEVSAQELTAALDDVEENIYENAQTVGGSDLAECIDDTGIRAIALYDYEAAADDEISFDPEDLITHIEQVIGWLFRSSGLIRINTVPVFVVFGARRSTKAGGEDCAKTATAYFRPTTFSCKNKSHTRYECLRFVREFFHTECVLFQVIPLM